MNLIDLMAAGFPAAIVILVLIGFYKVFVKFSLSIPHLMKLQVNLKWSFTKNKRSWLKMKFREIKEAERRKRIDSR